MAVKAYLETHDIGTLTLRKVAELAGVSPPTVYAHFPTMDHLARTFFNWLQPRLGQDMELPPLDELFRLPSMLFPIYDDHARLLQNFAGRLAWERLDDSARHDAWIEALSRETPGLAPEQLRPAALAISLLWTPTSWMWLVETCGFSSEEARSVAVWAIKALVEKLRLRPGEMPRTRLPSPRTRPETT